MDVIELKVQRRTSLQRMESQRLGYQFYLKFHHALGFNSRPKMSVEANFKNANAIIEEVNNPPNAPSHDLPGDTLGASLRLPKARPKK